MKLLYRWSYLISHGRSEGSVVDETDQKGDAMAKSQYQFKKRQKELAKKKKKEEKRQRKLENKGVEADETEKDPTPSMEDR